jgi:primosomal replication protein N
LRYTPAGIPVAEARLHHQGAEIENGSERQVELEIALLAIGPTARWLEAAPLGSQLEVSGFLAARSRNSRTPVLHVNTLEYLEGNKNGSILQEEG